MTQELNNVTEQTSALQALNETLAAAKAAAGALPAAAPSVSASVPALPTGGRPVSMREMIAEGGMTVKAYVRPQAAGFLIGKDTTTYVGEIAVEFKLSDAKPFYGLRYGDPAVYKRSIDRLVETKSKRSWAEVIAEATRIDPKCKGDYRGVDIPFTVLETVTPKKGGDALISEGEKLGWTSSVTNFNEFQGFIEPYFKLMDLGQIGEDAVVRGKIVNEQRTKAGVQPWGALTFVDFQITDAGTVPTAQ